MGKLLLLGPLLIVLLAADAPKADDAAAELKTLHGTWSIVKEINDGKEMPAEEARKIKVTFGADGKWQVAVEGKVVAQGTMTLDPAKKPKIVDYVVTEGDDKGKKFIAIYELDGDSFRHCGALKGARPTEFGSPAGSGQFLTMFRRDKK